ncbi:fumarylacetoacetate hydrolase family protein [Acidovorax sp. NCPPB 3576]|uniref:fumarylacetoacetate hydrolase family protein n=1 Tax=Acidovorax sp. NCPPB 3576 TaxID=2940488 RepID=UPI00234AB292|nr:fumarylacetoacetate hydrolase family protein [Acidovorax sp. NCPPB 3576]WCM88183.1 fumarylacetoacetate hydrolase family protein [Acidovorax sp. NCPPB 3576]
MPVDPAVNSADSSTPVAGIAAVAQALLQARATAVPADAQPLAAALPDAGAAYAVQNAVAHALGWWSTGVPRYWKSGGADRATVLTHAPLPEAGVWTHPAHAQAWPLAQRGIEAEIALRLGQEVDADTAAALADGEGAHLIDAMAVSIEIVETRWAQDGAVAGLLTLADQQSHGALVLGDWVAFDAGAPPDWAQQRFTVRITGQDAVERQGTHSLGDPAWLLAAWLRHATQHFGTLPAGTVVSTGNWAGRLNARLGDAVEVAFDGIGAASVQL